MKAIKMISPLVFSALNIWFIEASARASEAAKTVSTDVCAVLAEPGMFVNQVIRLRGLVYFGVDHMNISDRACPGRGIELAIKSERVFKQKDVHTFYIQLNHQGRKGVATITGFFHAYDDPLTPYMLDIQHVTDAAPRE